MIVHRVQNERVRERVHVLVMDRLEDSNCLVVAVADGLMMPNSNDYVLERMELPERAVDLRYLVSMNRVVSIHSVKLLSTVVKHHHGKVMALVLVLALDALHEHVGMGMWAQNSVRRIV